MPKVFACLLALLLAPTAAAQGLVQLSLGGRIDDRGGARVELEIGVMLEGQARQIELDVHVARETTGADVAALLARRLERAKFDMVFTPGRAQGEHAHLFIENTLFVRTRVGGGLEATITTCDAIPSAVRIVKPDASPEAATVHASASTLSPHTKERGMARFALEIDPGIHSAQIAEKVLAASAAAGWLADRPGGDNWRPTKMKTGERLTGFSVELDTEGDWRVEVELPRRESR